MITIVGAGMAGLLAGNLLRTNEPIQILEAQPELPNNHSAVLRFKSSAIGDALGIPFKKVTMIKDAVPWLNPVADALSYARKTFRLARSDRSITSGLVVAERFIAPPDLISQMAQRFEDRHLFLFNEKFGTDEKPDGPIISTIPMPALMEVLGYPNRPAFRYVEGINFRAKLSDCDAYVSLMIPDPDQPFSRISITGDELIVEVPDFRMDDLDGGEGGKLMKLIAERNIDKAAGLLGMDECVLRDTISSHHQPYAKIAPIDDEVRRDFIYWATHQHNVFSLGRFATWRPHLQLDDLLKDIELINRWVNSNSRYAVARQR